MEMKNVKHTEKKDVMITMRVTKETFKWLKQNKINYSKLLQESIEQLKKKEKKK